MVEVDLTGKHGRFGYIVLLKQEIQIFLLFSKRLNFLEMNIENNLT